MWQNRVAPLMDCCSKLKVFKFEKGRVQEVEVVDMTSMGIAERLKVLRNLQLDVVICNGISLFYRACLLINAVKVISNVIGEEQAVLARYFYGHGLINVNSHQQKG